MENFGEVIKQAISDQNLTQREVANLIHVSPQTLSAYVNNRRSPSLQCFINLVDLLGLKDSIFPNHAIDQIDVDKHIIEYCKVLNDEQKYLILILMKEFHKLNKKELKAPIKSD